MTLQHNCKCDQCESLRQENEKLKKQLDIAVKLLKSVQIINVKIDETIETNYLAAQNALEEIESVGK